VFFATASRNGRLPQLQPYRSQGHRGTEKPTCLYGQKRTLRTSRYFHQRTFWSSSEILDYFKGTSVSPKVHIKDVAPFGTLASGGDLLGGFEDNRGTLPLVASPDAPVASVSSIADKSTIATLIVSLLDQIRSLDKVMDEARIEKIAKIKKALADGTYHVSAAEVATKIIDLMKEP
jgi:anti-sigma28 factor (negative regulator of flagellin synthesis)